MRKIQTFIDEDNATLPLSNLTEQQQKALGDIIEWALPCCKKPSSTTAGERDHAI